MNNNNAATEKKMDTKATPQAPERKPDLQDAALSMAQMFSEGVAYSVTEDAWLRWTGTHWMDTGTDKTQLDNMAVVALRDVGVNISNNGKLEGTIRLAKALMKRELKAKKNVVNFANGTLDINLVERDGGVVWEVGQVRDHSIDDGLRYCLPYNLDPAGDYPLIRGFMEAQIPDPFARECLMAHVGLGLMGDTSMHYVLIIQGVTRSGKSVVLRLFLLMGGATLEESENFAPSNLFDTDLEAKRARFAQRHRMFVPIDELPSAALGGEENFKIMSGHGGISMRGMQRDDEVETAWKPKILTATNDIPKLKDPSGAMATRIVPILMPNHRREGQRDLLLVDKMEGELGAFAAACIQAALDAKNRGHYNRSRGMKNTLTAWGLLGNPLRAFVKDYCVLDPKHRAPTGRFHAKYEAVLRGKGQTALQQSNMTAELIAMGIGVHQQRGRTTYREHGNEKPYNGYCLYGIALREDLGLSVMADECDDELDEHDYTPAVVSDMELLEEAQGWVNVKEYDRAYKLIQRVSDADDRQYALDMLKVARMQPVQMNMLGDTRTAHAA